MIERLTKSGGPFVNTFFKAGLIGTPAAGAIRVALAYWRETGPADAIGITIISLVQWCVTPGLYRLWKS